MAARAAIAVNLFPGSNRSLGGRNGIRPRNRVRRRLPIRASHRNYGSNNRGHNDDGDQHNLRSTSIRQRQAFPPMIE